MRTIKTILLICGIIVAMTSTLLYAQKPSGQAEGQKSDMAREYYDLGCGALKDKQYEKARDFFMQSLACAEFSPEVYARLGDTYAMLKDDELANDNYSQCLAAIIKLNSPAEEMTKLRDEMLRKKEKFRPLEDKAANLEKEFVSRLIELGQKCMEQEDWLFARELFALAAQTEPDNAEATENLQKANDAWKSASPGENAQDDIELAKACLQSGQAFSKQGKLDDAIEKLLKAVSCQKNFPEARFALAECYDKQKNAKDAAINYRLCVNGLRQKDSLTAEEKNLLASAERNLEKIDTKNNELKSASNKYITGLLGVAGEFNGKKYLSYALRIYSKVLKLDPDNKTAVDATRKIKEQSTDKKIGSAKNGLQLFNGENLNGWACASIWLQLWSVDKPCMIFNQNLSAEPSLITYEKPFPQTYMLSMEFFLEKRLPAKNYEISITYGQSLGGQQQNVLEPKKVSCAFGRIGIWCSVKLYVDLKQKKYRLEEDTKITKSGKIENCDKTLFGFYFQGYRAKLRNITLFNLD